MAVICQPCPKKLGTRHSEELGPLLAGGAVEAETKANHSQPQEAEEVSRGVASPWTLLQAVRAMRGSNPSRSTDTTSEEPMGQDVADFHKANRVWGLMKKRPRYQQVRKSRVVADCIEDVEKTEDGGCDNGGAELHSMLSPIVTIHSLRERISNLAPRSQHSRQQPPPPPPASPMTQLPNKLEVKGEICLLTDSPYRILRARNAMGAGHQGIYGNHKADQLDKKGSDIRVFGIKPDRSHGSGQHDWHSRPVFTS